MTEKNTASVFTDVSFFTGDTMARESFLSWKYFLSLLKFLQDEKFDILGVNIDRHSITVRKISNIPGSLDKTTVYQKLCELVWQLCLDEVLVTPLEAEYQYSINLLG